MTMWIERIELSHFKAYQQQTFVFPKPRDGRNLVLIGGMNGHGKTTLLEAIYLCLYGEEAVSHLARAGLKENAYVRFLQNALHGRAQGRRDNAMRVSVRFMVQDDYGFRVTRNWYFDPRGGYQDQDVHLYEIHNGVEKPLKADDDLKTVLQRYAVPAHLAPFFFFDGEEVKKLAALDQKGWIKQGMENLMGVVLVRYLRERLVQYQNNRRQGATAKAKSEIDEMLAAIKRQEAERQRLEETWKACLSEIEILEARRNTAQEKLINLGAGNGNIKSVEDILREESELRHELDACKKSLETLLGDRLPFHLVAPGVLDSLRAHLASERILTEWEERKKNREPDKERFKQRFFASKHLAHLGDMELSGLRLALDEAWESLYWPRPEGCAESLLHGYLEPRQRQRLEESQSAVRVGAEEIRTRIREQARIRQRLRELENRRLRLQGVDDDGTLKELIEELKRIETQLNEKYRQRGDLERQRTSLDAAINQARADYERENARYLQAEPSQSVVRKAERVKVMIDELLPQLFDLKTRELSARVTERFKSLAHRGWIDRIEIQADGSARLIGQNGQEIRFDPSAGENQIFATALFAGLADVSGYRIPLVVDTPMARLDSQHRQNLLAYWRTDPDRQVILLSQDREVDESMAKELSPFLAKAYRLDSRPIGDGLYHTVAQEGYFGGVL